MPEGDSGASAVARAVDRGGEAPGPLRINVPAWVATNFEGIVARPATDQVEDHRHDDDHPGDHHLDHHLWKLVRTFDDPATWTEPGVRQLASDGPGGPTFRTDVLPDQHPDRPGQPASRPTRLPIKIKEEKKKDLLIKH